MQQLRKTLSAAAGHHVQYDDRLRGRSPRWTRLALGANDYVTQAGQRRQRRGRNAERNSEPLLPKIKGTLSVVCSNQASAGAASSTSRRHCRRRWLKRDSETWLKLMSSGPRLEDPTHRARSCRVFRPTSPSRLLSSNTCRPSLRGTWPRRLDQTCAGKKRSRCGTHTRTRLDCTRRPPRRVSQGQGIEFQQGTIGLHQGPPENPAASNT